ncbi:MAG: histidine phosphatase family protein [Caulobacteraceae bacterium]|nr:histidine phosphatase family protein [Caulobacteraceae bacterium]
MPADALTTRTASAMTSTRDETAPRAGAIILTRHGEPDLSRKVRLNAAGYADWWATYEERGLKPGQSAPRRLLDQAREAVIVSSTRPRAIESGHAVAEGRLFEKDPALIEAPLPPPNWPRWLKLAPRTWGVVARVWWWFFNHHAGQETRAEAEVRADLIADRLIALAQQGRDVLVIAHGFFNTMIGLALRRRGWKLVEDQGYRYWSSRRFERG